ncbi:MAG: HEAT repeat domain-containing protein [Planctomycetes bacterium]|nr:HEAT repeat domain-containing protein [Planctomycetota bacterium]
MSLEEIIFWWRSRSLTSPKFSRRLQAVKRLPARPAKAASQRLIEMLADHAEEIRSLAATRLADVHHESAVAPLVKLLLHEPVPGVREAAARALIAFPPNEWTGMATAALDDPLKTVRESASWILRSIGWAHIDEILRGRVAVLRSDWSLAKEIGPPAVAPLQAVLRNGTTVARREAAETLGHIGDITARDAVLAVLRDRRVDRNSREVAAWALHRFCWPDVEDMDDARAAIALGDWAAAATIGAVAVEPLSNALKDPLPAVRLAAADALAQIADRPAIDALSVALIDQTQPPEVRRAIANRLGTAGGEHVVAVLVAALADNHWIVREAAAKSLAEMDWTPSRDWDRILFAIARKDLQSAARIGEAAIKSLVEALWFPAVCEQAAKTLAGMGAAGAGALVRISRDMTIDFAIREIASTTLAAAGDERAIHPLYDMLRDDDLAVRKSAVWTLERIGWKPRNDMERAIAALAHEDWVSLRQLGAVSIELLLAAFSEPNAPPEVIATIEKILETAAARVSIEQLRRISRLGAGNHHRVHEAGGVATAALTDVASAALVGATCAKVVKFAALELVRRGILH